jgi:hypothetical protein
MTLLLKLCLVLIFVGATASWTMEDTNEGVPHITVKRNVVYDSDDDIIPTEETSRKRIKPIKLFLSREL